jgi:hypothetical protein
MIHGDSMRIHGLVLALALALLSARGAAAVQEESKQEDGVGTAALVYARATGPFAENVRHALGLTLTAHRNVERTGVFALGLDVTYLLYNYETRNLWSVDEVVAKSQILTLGAGPQVRVRIGTVEPYVTASVGFALFSTDSCARDGRTYPEEECSGTVHAVNLAFPASAAGAGVRIRLTQGTEPISLDLGARYQRTPRVRYVTQDGLDVFDYDVVQVTTARSRTALWLFYVGVSMPM